MSRDAGAVVPVRTERREQFVDVTETVSRTVAEHFADARAVVVYCPHTTAGVVVNERADPAVAADMVAGLRRLVPEHAGWRHAEGNADAHIKAALVGSSAIVPVSGGRLALGTWQGVFLAEFDGPRSRTLRVYAL